MTPFRKAHQISAEASLNEALKRMRENGLGRLIVMSGDHRTGLITKTGLRRMFQIRQALEA